MSIFRNYDPQRIVVTWGSIIMQGYATDSFVEVAREVETFTKQTGAGGDVTRTRNRNRSGTVTVRLMQASPTNDLLAARLRLDEQTGLGYAPLTVQDLNGTTLHSAPNAWIQKPADDARGAEAGELEWIFDCDVLDMFNGGAVV